jgi:hypothetical protein
MDAGRPGGRIETISLLDRGKKPLPETKNEDAYRTTLKKVLLRSIESRRGLNGTFNTMTGLLIGYARVSTNDHDLTAQTNALATLGVTPGKTFTD